MAQFRKKPVVIEAVQLTWDTLGDLRNFITPDYFDSEVYVHPFDNDVWDVNPIAGVHISEQRVGLIITTLEGNHLAVQNDWIIKGVKGEFYPCKPDIFDLTYEKL
jgi:hypothetical protein